VALGLIGVLVALIGADENTVARWVLGILAFFGLWFLVQMSIFRALHAYAMPDVVQREDEVQAARRIRGIEPWWPERLDATRATFDSRKSPAQA
jgi:hypothetical protein